MMQIKEMGGRSRPVDSLKINEQPGEKKKGLVDWMNIIKPGNEEKDHWVTLVLTLFSASSGCFWIKHLNVLYKVFSIERSFV